IVFFVFLALSFISLDKSFPQKNIYLYFFIVLVLFVGLRFASHDYSSYQGIYQSIDSFSGFGLFNYHPSDGTRPIESLYALFTLLVKGVGANYEVFLFTFAMVSVGIKFYAIKKMSNFIFLSLLLYVGMWMGKDLGRSGLASALILLSILYLHERKLLTFNFAVLSATLIHFLAGLGFFIYLIRYFNRNGLMWVVLIVALFVAFWGGIGRQLASIIYSLTGDERLIIYIHTDYADSIRILSGTFLIHFFISIFSLYFYGRLKAINIYNTYLVPIYIYSFSFMCFFLDYGIIAYRISDMFILPASVVLIPSFILLFKPNSRFLAYLIWALYSMLAFYSYVDLNLPYQSIIFSYN
ncbi:MAG: EpsG family protein, partial [Campylobacterales bacterium]|nr:EpsG family protein [Campylobacterales bacterium]